MSARGTWEQRVNVRCHHRGMTELPQAPDDSAVVIVGPDGLPVAEMVPSDDPRSVTDLVQQPAKVMRIGSMVKQLLDEVKSAPLDDAARSRLRDIHERSLAELEDGLAPELVAELRRLALPFTDDEVPTEAELRIAQAQLVGWLEGLFHGIQTALFAQQVAARAQFEEIRRRGGQAMLPAGMAEAVAEEPGPGPGSGPYL